MAITKTLAAFMAALTTVTSLPARGYGPHVPATVACTTGTPVTTAGYQVNYVQATPAGYATNAGYQPRSDWASQHVVASYVSRGSCLEPRRY